MRHVRVEVREIAEGKGWNISKLARRADLSYPTVLGFWHGRTGKVDLQALAAVADVLGVKVADLIVEGEPGPGGTPSGVGKSQGPVLAGAF